MSSGTTQHSARGRFCFALVEDGDRDVRRDARFYRDGALVEWSSLTKTVTARLLMELERAGLVHRDMRVVEALPSLDLGDATLKDLSAHRSGLPVMHSGASRGLIGDPCRGALDMGFIADRADVFARDARRHRGEYRYSNLGYAVLGAALEAVTGQDWFELVRERVLPAERFSTVTATPEPSQRALPRLVGFRREPWSMSAGIYRAAGGLWSSFDELVGYAEETMQIGRYEGWFVLRDGVYHHTAQSRDTGACIVIDSRERRLGVAHAMLRGPDATKKLLESLMF